VLFTSGTHLANTPLIARTVRNILRPSHLIGCGAVATLAHRLEVEAGPSTVLWAGKTGPVQPLRLSEPALPSRISDGPLLLIADPHSFDASALAASLGPNETVVGGLASASSLPGGNCLVLDNDTFTNGAVAIVLPPDLEYQAIVATGCHPVGDPMVVTDAQGPIIRSLAGRPALDRLESLAANADDALRERLRKGLHLGIVLDERREAFSPGDFLIRGILGAQRETRSLAVGAKVEVGSTVQFQVRDAAAATRDLADRLRTVTAETALAFTCNGRGSHLFGKSGHDAEHLVDGLGTTDVAGMFCAGEIGPVGAGHHLHGFTASILLLGSQTA